MMHQDIDLLKQLKSVQVILADQVEADEKVLEVLKKRMAANRNLLARLEENLGVSHGEDANTAKTST